MASVAYGVIRTDREAPLPERLAVLAKELECILATHEPDSVAVERVLFQNNARTAMSVGQASGVALLCAARAGLNVGVYSPNEVKLAVAGFGGADKDQVTKMVVRVLSLDATPKPADAGDALAIAITHLNSARLRASIARSAG